MSTKNFDKLFISLKFYLLGRRYFTALKALDFARLKHSGLRKDGVTPEFQHQIEIALYLSTLRDVSHEESLLTVSLLHDVMEDFNISKDEMEARFGAELTKTVWLLTKKFNGIKKDYPSYFDAIGSDAIASLVKGADRINNVQTMVGVFSEEKQKEYIHEVETYFLPMLKRAKYNFPEQTAAYYNIIHILKSQVQLVKAIHAK